MRADRLQRADRDAEQRHHVGASTEAAAGFTEQRLVRGGGRRVQRVGVRQLLLLGQQRRVLARHRATASTSASPSRSVSASASRSRSAGQRLELLPDRAVPVVHPPVVGQGGAQFRAAEPVQRVPRPPGLEQLPLIRLPVHGDQVVGQHLQQRHRHRMPARERPGTSFGRHGTAQHQRGPVVVEISAGVLDLARHLGETSSRPSTAARAAPGRTRAGSALPPNSSPSAVTTMVFPAPVSPVSAVNPAESSSTASSITPSR